ncbi:unnamed protein product [Arctogadus glacialis]
MFCGFSVSVCGALVWPLQGTLLRQGEMESNKDWGAFGTFGKPATEDLRACDGKWDTRDFKMQYACEPASGFSSVE